MQELREHVTSRELRETLSASIVVTTHDRDRELEKCLRSLARQRLAMDVIVMDDFGGTNTEALVQEILPSARYFNLARSKGCTFQRNRGVELARCDIVFAFDDDIEVPDSSTLETTLRDFDTDNVAAVGIPFTLPHSEGTIFNVSDRSDRILHAFIGAAHAVRKSLFMKVGGYREHFFMYGEEGDLAIRLAELGYTVRAGTAVPVIHLESPRRSTRNAAIHGRKNDILFALHNVPFPFLIRHLVATTLNGLWFGVRTGHVSWHLRGILMGYRAAWAYRQLRNPVAVTTYREFRALKKTKGVSR